MSSEQYQEIDKLIHQYKAGNEEALFELYEFYKPLFLSSIKRIVAKDLSFASHKEDLLSDCIFALKKLIDQYDPKLSYFSYFLSTRIDITLFRLVSDKYSRKEEYSEEVKFTEQSYDPFNKIENVICLHDAINQLDDNHKQIIQMYFFDGIDQKEAAKILNITQGALSKRLSKALEKLKKHLGDDFLF